MSTEKYPVRGWTVTAVPDSDGTTTLTRPYAVRGIRARNAQDAISTATQPSAAQVRALMAVLGRAHPGDLDDYDSVRAILTRVLREPEVEQPCGTCGGTYDKWAHGHAPDCVIEEGPES